MSVVTLVVTTAPAEGVAALVAPLLEENLAACVNVVGPVQSHYRWQGALEQATESVLLIKTTAARCVALRERLVELHPYDVPEVLEFAASGGAAHYLEWVAACCRPPEG